MTASHKEKMRADVEKRRLQAICRNMLAAKNFLAQAEKDVPAQTALYAGLRHQLEPIYSRAMERLVDILGRTP